MNNLLYSLKGPFTYYPKKWTVPLNIKLHIMQKRNSVILREMMLTHDFAFSNFEIVREFTIL